jgi:choline transport protein
MLFATISIMTTSSRMTWAFARDRGLPFSRFFAQVNPTLDIPLNALYATTAWVIIFGCIFLGSSSAFNAIVSASVVALGITYAIPLVINCLQGRKKLPESRPFKLHPVLGWACNLLGTAYTIVTTVLFLFPSDLPTTGTGMNYAVVAFAVVLIISVVQWFVDGRKNYTGPKLDVGRLANGEVVGLAVEEQKPVNGGAQKDTDEVEG